MAVIVSSVFRMSGVAVSPPVGGFTPGSVPFATASSVLGQDNANLFWDNTNKRLGIGTNAPVRTLDVASGIVLARMGLHVNDGTAAAPSVTASNFSSTGFSWSPATLAVSVGGVIYFNIRANQFSLAPGAQIDWNGDVVLTRDAAGVLALKNGVVAQEFRVYGTTTGPKYLSLLHAGTDGVVNSNSGNLFLRAGTGWAIGSTGILVPEGDNDRALGSSGLRVSAIHAVQHFVYDAVFLLRSGVALPNGAAAALGTLANAPVAGNPTKWIPIDDNGTTRYLPAW